MMPMAFTATTAAIAIVVVVVVVNTIGVAHSSRCLCGYLLYDSLMLLQKLDRLLRIGDRSKVWVEELGLKDKWWWRKSEGK